MEYFRDNILEMKKYELKKGKELFESILKERKGQMDPKRFFLRFLPLEEYKKYDFNNLESLEKFRDDCLRNKVLMEMGGCNLTLDEIKKGIRYGGIMMSDPYSNVIGQFHYDIEKKIMIYSPIFPEFYNQRDLVKFANDDYFTTISFEEIILMQIENSKRFYVHTGNFENLQDIIKNKEHKLEEVSKEEFIEFLVNPKKGKLIEHNYIYRNRVNRK